MNLFLTLILIAIFAETSAITIKVFSGKGRASRSPRRKVFVDTSILMDGRILSVAKSGFLGDELLIPRSVIRELQLLADGKDSEKRTRARYGLDVVNELERIELADVSIYQDSADWHKVDERLLELAKEHKGLVMTNDYNLAKVAATEHIDVITINDLAQGLRSEYLPGDRLNLKIISAGSNPKQGVAYLPDGTMVVIDDAERFAGKNIYVDVVFERYLQTAAGRMMFAKLAPEKTTPAKTRKARTARQSHGRSPQDGRIAKRIKTRK